jgi:hypothetical protein
MSCHRAEALPEGPQLLARHAYDLLGHSDSTAMQQLYSDVAVLFAAVLRLPAL